ncbi:MAG: NAD(P)-binding protein, partial [Longimicrobiales bacterium]|nr:NAD(P)-binding protein [Longimicrobiales bacterium]
MSALLSKFVTYGAKPIEVVYETGLDVSARDGFELCRDYAGFIRVILSQQGVDPDPKWIEGGPGEVGGVVRYRFKDGSIITEEVSRLEEDPERGVYALEYRMLDPAPFPLRNHWCTWTLTQEAGHPNRCRLRWVRHFDEPRILGLVSLGRFLHGKFLRSARPIVSGTVRPWLGKHFPSGERRLPLPSDRVLVVGAGPSGLHMSHLLRNRVGVKDITVVELSDRIGGKTVSIDDQEHPGVVHELGTCYLHPAYFAVRALVDELKEMPGCDDPDFGKEVAPVGYAIEGAGRESYSLEEWVTSRLQGQPK